jgi:hypothetical protein
MIDTSLIELEIDKLIEQNRLAFNKLSFDKKFKNCDVRLIPMLLNIKTLVREVRLLSMSLEDNNNTKD